MTKYTPEMAHAAAARGARWFDEHYPGWLDDIDLDELNMADGYKCMLGQTSERITGDSHYWRGFGGVLHYLWTKEIALSGGDWAAKHGFICQRAHIDEENTVYEMLGIAWRQLITERREEQSRVQPQTETTDRGLRAARRAPVRRSLLRVSRGN